MQAKAEMNLGSAALTGCATIPKYTALLGALFAMLLCEASRCAAPNAAGQAAT
jgi:hypothetical protein